ncbi:MAG: hypothetical protein ACRYFR_04370 [Janthinobacterium lividum]
MKKTFVLAALALAAVGSWAFYPKAVEPSGYMMVIGRTYPDYSLTTITPAGESTTQVIDSKSYILPNKLVAASEALRIAEIRKINELKAAGWKVNSMSVYSSNREYSEQEVYLLEK